MTIALSSDFIPHMVYKWRKSAKGNLEGYIRWSVTGESANNTGCPICPETWVGLTLILDVPPCFLAAQPILPKSNMPKQNWADRGTTKFKVYTTQVSDQMGHPVVLSSNKT